MAPCAAAPSTPPSLSCRAHINLPFSQHPAMQCPLLVLFTSPPPHTRSRRPPFPFTPFSLSLSSPTPPSVLLSPSSAHAPCLPSSDERPPIILHRPSRALTGSRRHGPRLSSSPSAFRSRRPWLLRPTTCRRRDEQHNHLESSRSSMATYRTTTTFDEPPGTKLHSRPPGEPRSSPTGILGIPLARLSHHAHAKPLSGAAASPRLHCQHSPPWRGGEHAAWRPIDTPSIAPAPNGETGCKLQEPACRHESEGATTTRQREDEVSGPSTTSGPIGSSSGGRGNARTHACRESAMARRPGATHGGGGDCLRDGSSCLDRRW
ncbi:hypothetical protein B0T16DRAFT_7854 [Cercophora newfieldiana]|uniref:Uncharacterized protein n=1 Tax=Cercophora newfieldiana TaxID=92897 RepID=A0AA40CXJ7_9PEZI|nr:hypothetical protein B0T16DRAFT_7854 [Cercophora newfieldiana]